MTLINALDDTDELSDHNLLQAVRDGDGRAYGVLWQRHERAGLAAARAITSKFDADDIVSEAFVSILRTLQAGGGPTELFRPYLYATIRNLAATWGRKATDVTVDYLDERAATIVADDPFEQIDERSTLAQSFRTLPERWRTLLWYTEVEGMKPREIAPLMGMTANAVSALIYRARDGLRNAWLEAHIADPSRPEECRWVCTRVVTQGKKALARADRPRFSAHLSSCAACRIVAADIEQVSTRLRAILLPVVLGSAGAAAMFGAETGTAVAAGFGAGDGVSAIGSTGPEAGAHILSSTDASAPAAHALEAALHTGDALAVTTPAKSTGLAIAVSSGLVTSAVVLATAVFALIGAVEPSQERSNAESAAGAAPAVVELAPVVAEPVVEAAVEPVAPPVEPVAPVVPVVPGVPVEPAVVERVSTAPAPPVVGETEPIGPRENTPSAPIAPAFAVTTVLSSPLAVLPTLEGTGTPGARIRLEDEHGTTLAESIVDEVGAFGLSAARVAARQGMELLVVHSRDGAVDEVVTLGAMTFAVPAVVGGAPGDNVSTEHSRSMGSVAFALEGLGGHTIDMRIDDDPTVYSTTLTDGVGELTVPELRLGSHEITLAYVDPLTGARGVETTTRVTLVAAG
ncbi:sigma-70 family RNA polymerase sigma factor [Microbacterium lacus]|uniref:RNA polymerase sigma factor n=1 Tax=Microbacterium lacus TaxID=415217 RepID=UPI00384C2DB5